MEVAEHFRGPSLQAFQRNFQLHPNPAQAISVKVTSEFCRFSTGCACRNRLLPNHSCVIDTTANNTRTGFPGL